MTLAEMRDRAARRFFDPDRIRVTNDDWTDYLNDAYKTFIAEMPQPFTEERITRSTTADNEVIALDQNTYAVLSVLNTTTDRKLYPIENREQFLRLWNDRDDSGEPIHYQLHSNELLLFPTPDDTYSLEIYVHSEPVNLVNDPDLPKIPARYHRALIDHALSQATLDQGSNLERVSAYLSAFQKGVIQAVKELAPGQRTERNTPITDTFYHPEGR